MHIAIIIPVYNEARWVVRGVERVLQTLPPTCGVVRGVNAQGKSEPCQRTLILIDDGSTDGSIDLIKSLARKPGVEALYHARNQGKGAAIATGLAHALSKGVDAALIHDADLEYDPSDHEVALRPIIDGRADAVIGSRFLGQTHRVLYYWHSVANRAITTFSNMATNLNLTDIECCTKCFTRAVMQRLVITERGFGVEPEIVARLAHMRIPDDATYSASVSAAPSTTPTSLRPLRIYEVPVSYAGRTYAEGKKIKWTDGFNALSCIFKYGVLRTGS